MISKLISINETTPYCYLIGWSVHNKWYYGRRTAKNCHPSDLWVKYFTSSKGNYNTSRNKHTVESFRKLYGEPDVVQIRKTFDCIEKCCEWESRVLNRIDAAGDEKFLNQSNGKAMFSISDTFKVHTNNKYVHIKINSYLLDGTYQHRMINKYVYLDMETNKKIFAYKTDDRIALGKLVLVTKDNLSDESIKVVDSKGNIHTTISSDSRINTKEVFKLTQENYTKIMLSRPIVTTLNNIANKYNVSITNTMRMRNDIENVIANIINGIIQPKQISNVKTDVMQMAKTELRNRPEVIYLKEIANTKNITPPPNWECKKDLEDINRKILDGPSNISYHHSNSQESKTMRQNFSLQTVNRQEVVELSEHAKSKNIILPNGWKLRKDLSEIYTLVNGASDMNYFIASLQSDTPEKISNAHKILKSRPEVLEIKDIMKRRNVILHNSWMTKADLGFVRFIVETCPENSNFYKGLPKSI